jgi:hypothetical protein
MSQGKARLRDSWSFLIRPQGSDPYSRTAKTEGSTCLGKGLRQAEDMLQDEQADGEVEPVRLNRVKTGEGDKGMIDSERHSVWDKEI